MTREELIAYDKWLTRRKWGTGEIISPERAADIYLAEHSLPPAEGAVPDNAAEQNKRMREWFKERTGLDDTLLSIHMKQIDVMLKGVQQQPTAEGAEQRIRVRNILQDFYRRGEYELEQAEEDIMRLFQQQPTAEGAEEILEKHCHLQYNQNTGEREVCSSVSAVEIAMQEFATLHAQRLAEKMVSERLREELMAYDKFLSNTYWGVSHLVKRDEVVDEYLKTREK